MVNVRVQGAIRSYAFGLLPEGKAAILKNDNGYRVMKEMEFAWMTSREYEVAVTVRGSRIRAKIDGKVLEVTDEERPYLSGAVGMSMVHGCHDQYRRIAVSAV